GPSKNPAELALGLDGRGWPSPRGPCHRPRPPQLSWTFVQQILVFILSIIPDFVRLGGERAGRPNSMQYVLLICGNEAHWGTLSSRRADGVMKEYNEFTNNIAKSRHLRGGNARHPTSKATTVRLRGKKRSVTDGPFAETKEQLGGYCLIEVKDLDEALSIAERIPSVRWERSRCDP